MFEEEVEEQDAGAPAWVVTFGDMMSLLLTFFVMMLSFSEIDQVKFKGVMGAIKEAFGVQTIEAIVNNPKGPNLTIPRGSMDSILEYLSSVVPNAFPKAQVSREGEGVLVVIPGNVFFDSGEAALKDAAKPVLAEMAGLLKRQPEVSLQVEGHTDNVPIATARFPSNWELSAARSIAVIRVLMEDHGVFPTRLTAAGFADTFPLVPNDSADNREKNRRVEFRFVERPGKDRTRSGVSE